MIILNWNSARNLPELGFRRQNLKSFGKIRGDLKKTYQGAKDLLLIITKTDGGRNAGHRCLEKPNAGVPVPTLWGRTMVGSDGGPIHSSKMTDIGKERKGRGENSMGKKYWGFVDEKAAARIPSNHDL